MKKAFFILLLSSAIWSCTSPLSPAPADLIPQKKMTGILFDLHVAEARVDNMGMVMDTGSIYFKNLQQQVFKKHKITEKDFYKSYDYYLDNVSELDKIYEKVVDSLSLAETKAAAAPAVPLQKVQ